MAPPIIIAPMKYKKFLKIAVRVPKYLISMGSVKMPTIIRVVIKTAITG
jgi:hypothetical protein